MVEKRPKNITNMGTLIGWIIVILVLGIIPFIVIVGVAGGYAGYRKNKAIREAAEKYLKS